MKEISGFKKEKKEKEVNAKIKLLKSRHWQAKYLEIINQYPSFLLLKRLPQLDIRFFFNWRLFVNYA